MLFGSEGPPQPRFKKRNDYSTLLYMDREKAPRNRTITLTPEEQQLYLDRCLRVDGESAVEQIIGRTLFGDFCDISGHLPKSFVDLLFIDPPYNLNKQFNSSRFRQKSAQQYEELLEGWIERLVPLLKPTASIYVCTDWRSTAEVKTVLERRFIIRNRIVWEREKGRGAKNNWKNSTEDIWFATVSDDYYFNVEAVKLKRRVLAPYRDPAGRPKDWDRTGLGDFRLTHPSNIWTDITVPYWSMPENTDHPTQKPEKLLAKIILASSKEGDIVFDPFAGAGTASVTAKKLGRRYCGIELDPLYAALTEKRLALADEDASIQGFREGVFWERNSYWKGEKGGKGT
jgi:site-specific DNA-methyltransferase (adenine-specific)